MALTWYTSAGQPADTVGSDGDLSWDYQNRITWGPKGRVTAGSWAGTAYSNIGPTGPAMLSGTGAPASTYGQNGNGYCDVATGNTYYKSNNAWTQSGSIVGPTGATGAAGTNGTSGAIRNIFRGEWWRYTAPTANTAYPVANILSASSQNSSANAYDIVANEPMWTSGSLVAVTAFSVSNVAGVLTINVLKNNTVVATAASILTNTTSGNLTTGYKVLASGLTFAQGDVISMTGSSTTASGNQHMFCNLFYNTSI